MVDMTHTTTTPKYYTDLQATTMLANLEYIAGLLGGEIYTIVELRNLRVVVAYSPTSDPRVELVRWKRTDAGWKMQRSSGYATTQQAEDAYGDESATWITVNEV